MWPFRKEKPTVIKGDDAGKCAICGCALLTRAPSGPFIGTFVKLVQGPILLSGEQ
jgi:hypothetical protein